jgi:PEP-CTERM motif
MAGVMAASHLKSIISDALCIPFACINRGSIDMTLNLRCGLTLAIWSHVVRSSFLVAIASWGLCAPVSAALIAQNSSLGPNTVTLQTEADLEWLDLSFSRSLALDDVLADTAAGQPLEGFRLATDGEVLALFVEAGITMLSDPSGRSAAQYPGAQLLADTLGLTSFDPPFDSASALSASGVLATPYSLFLYGVDPINVTGFATEGALLAIDTSRGIDNRAAFLVRTVTRVPEPGALSLLVFGLAALAVRRRS